MKKLIFGISALVVMLASTVNGAWAANSTVVVKPSDMATSMGDVVSDPSKWLFYNDENDQVDNSLGSFVVGPGTAPAGTDSVQISVSGTQRRNLATYRFSGTVLSDITTLAFSTYNPSAGNPGSVNRSGYLHFNVDLNGTDTWQRRLVFVPSLNGTIVQDSWQEWDAIQGGNAKWLYSGATWPVTGQPGTTPKTWSQILSDYPGARMRVNDSFLGIRVGEPYADGYTENIDAFKFGTAAGVTTFDFDLVEEVVPPTTYAQCKGEGWKMFNNPPFTSKSKCEKYVKDHDHKIKGDDVIYKAYNLKREVDLNMSVAEGGGSFEYDDANKGWYNVKVTSVKVSGNTGYFAGKVVKASNPAWVNQWLFGKVVDNGNSGDQIWGSFTDMTSAQNGVENMSNPADGPFTVTKKNITVN